MYLSEWLPRQLERDGPLNGIVPGQRKFSLQLHALAVDHIPHVYLQPGTSRQCPPYHGMLYRTRGLNTPWMARWVIAHHITGCHTAQDARVAYALHLRRTCVGRALDMPCTCVVPVHALHMRWMTRCKCLLVCWAPPETPPVSPLCWPRTHSRGRSTPQPAGLSP